MAIAGEEHRTDPKEWKVAMPRLWKKPKAVEQLRASRKLYQLRDYYSSQTYFDDPGLSIKLTFPADLPCGVLSEDAVCPKHFQME